MHVIVVIMKMCLKSRMFKSYLCEYAIKAGLLSFLIKIRIPVLSKCRHQAVVCLKRFFHYYAHLFIFACFVGLFLVL